MTDYCKEGRCNWYVTYKTEGIISWQKQKQTETRMCCKVCEFAIECEKKCTKFDKECSNIIQADSWKEAWGKWMKESDDAYDSLHRKEINENV